MLPIGLRDIKKKIKAADWVNVVMGTLGVRLISELEPFFKGSYRDIQQTYFDF